MRLYDLFSGLKSYIEEGSKDYNVVEWMFCFLSILSLSKYKIFHSFLLFYLLLSVQSGLNSLSWPACSFQKIFLLISLTNSNSQSRCFLSYIVFDNKFPYLVVTFLRASCLITFFLNFDFNHFHWFQFSRNPCKKFYLIHPFPLFSTCKTKTLLRMRVFFSLFFFQPEWKLFK